MRIGSVVTIRIAHGRTRVQTLRAARPPEGFVDRDVVCAWCAQPVRCRIFGARETRRRRIGYVVAGVIGILAGTGILAYLQSHAGQPKPARALPEQLVADEPSGGVLAVLALGFVCTSLVGLAFLLRAWREIGVTVPGPGSHPHRLMRPVLSAR